jgi:tetratricopeptide (TPR) repeat protein
MPPSDPLVPPLSPDIRRVASESHDKANQVLATGNHDYGIKLLLTCCKLDPANLVYRRSLRKAQKSKYGGNLRGSTMSMLTTAPLKAALKTAKARGEHLKVLETGEEILCRNPWDLATQMDMANAADGLNLLDVGIWLLDQAREKDAKDVNLNRALARLFEKAGDFKRAGFVWNLVRQADPADAEAGRKAKDLLASETIARGGYTAAVDRVMAGKESGVIAAAVGYVPPAADDAADETPTIEVMPDIDKVARANPALFAKLKTNPTDVGTYLQAISLYRQAQQTDAARAVLEQGLAATGQAFELLLEQHDLDIEPVRHNLEVAERKLVSAKGPAAEELRKLRVGLVRELNAREAEVYRLKSDRFPTDTASRLELGIRLLKAGQIDAAIQELQTVRKDGRFLWRALVQLGFCFKARNNWRLAQRNFEEALQQMPPTEEDTRKEVFYQLATGFANAGDLAKALDLGNELANLDFGFRDIGALLDDWQARHQQA